MAAIYGAFADRAAAGQNVFVTTPTQGLTVRDILNDILLLWGITTPLIAPAYMMARAIHDMNGAFQMIWAMAKDADYFSRTTLTLTFGTGVTEQTLPAILGVLGPARFASNSQPLRPISTRSQYDSYGPTFLGSLSYAVPSGTPQAFFIEKLNIDAPDDVTNIMHVVPAPSSSVEVLLDVSIQVPRYVWNDYILATPVQFPHKYADSVLIPFCRYRAMTSFLLADPSLRPSLVADYQGALKLIGAVDPGMKEVEFAERASDRASN